MLVSFIRGTKCNLKTFKYLPLYKKYYNSMETKILYRKAKRELRKILLREKMFYSFVKLSGMPCKKGCVRYLRLLDIHFATDKTTDKTWLQNSRYLCGFVLSMIARKRKVFEERY